MTKLCMCFDAGCFYLGPRAHLKKGALRPYYYYYQPSLVAENIAEKLYFYYTSPDLEETVTLTLKKATFFLSFSSFLSFFVFAWHLMMISSLVTKSWVVQKIYLWDTWKDRWTQWLQYKSLVISNSTSPHLALLQKYHCDLDLEHNNPIFSQDTLAYGDMLLNFGCRGSQLLKLFYMYAFAGD